MFFTQFKKSVRDIKVFAKVHPLLFAYNHGNYVVDLMPAKSRDYNDLN